MPDSIAIEVVSDVVCPWCYVGKRRLDAALAARPDMDVRVTWQPFQLSPDMPREGRDRAEHYQSIFGEERARQIMASMRDTGAEDGIEFTQKPGARSPNTLRAHALMHMAAERDIDTTALVERLFHAHHTECLDIGDVDVLADIAAQVGMDDTEVRKTLLAGELEPAVEEAIGESVRRGVSGVPVFIINGRYGISGAQPADSLMAALDQIASAEASES